MVMNTPKKVHSSQRNQKEMKNSAKTWTSFDNSPIHSTPGPHTSLPGVKNEDGWTTFSDARLEAEAMSLNSSHSHTAAVGPIHASNSRIEKVKSAQKNDGQSLQNLPRQHSQQMHQMVTGPATPNQINVLGHATSSLHDRSQMNLNQHPLTSPVASSAIQSHINITASVPNVSAAVTSKHGVLHAQTEGSIIHGHISSDEGHRQLQSEESLDDSKIHDTNSQDSWRVTDEQRNYYINQFETMQPNLGGKIGGQTARNFFTKSRLPIPELSHIWELSDMDQDGHLTLDEFCAAFHLVVARKNGYDLPSVLPQSLVPTLIDIRDTKTVGISAAALTANKQVVPPAQQQIQTFPTTVPDNADSNGSHEHGIANPQPQIQQQSKTLQEKWETFSDRTSSSTTLANFDQVPENMENLAHPIPLHITPARQETHKARIRGSKSPPKSTDDCDSSPPPPLRVPVPHRSLTNPYGSLTNDFSEPDSSFENPKQTAERRRFISSSSTSPVPKTTGPTSAGLKLRSSSVSSNSSVATSERSSEIESSFHVQVNNHSDQEHSDWSSRPLRPRSGSDSSLESPTLQSSVLDPLPVSNIAPTPPPRPNQQTQRPTTISVGQTGGPDIITSAPTPPPRPPQSTPATNVIQQEAFADFSQFESKQSEEEPNVSAVKVAGIMKQAALPQSDPTPEEMNKPVPAPRHARDGKSTKESSEPELSEVSPERTSHKKAPAKPPRSRIMSQESSKNDHSSKKSIQISLPDDELKLPECPTQEYTRTKAALQQSIKDLKLHNNEITRLNAELQQELKDVMQSRIAVEMSIHQLRPFSQ